MDVRFSREGDQAWCHWIESHQIEEHQLEASGGAFKDALFAAWIKMESYAARIMLILHVIRRESGKITSENVDGETVKAAERLIRYFKAHAIRVYSEALSQGRPGRTTSDPTRVSTQQSAPSAPPGKPQADDRAIQWILRRGNGGVRPRDLVAAKITPNAQEAKGILDRLVQQGAGDWSKRERQRVERFYLEPALSTQQSADQEAA